MMSKLGKSVKNAKTTKTKEHDEETMKELK